MTIVYVTDGDIFKSEMQTLINAVNCVGDMGAGLALAFKKRYPRMNESYYASCMCGALRPGMAHVFKETDGTIIWNFPSKDDWRNPSELSFIQSGLEYFVQNYKKHGVESVAFPALGCGLGGLNFDDVKKLMIEYLGNIDIPVEVYLPK